MQIFLGWQMQNGNFVLTSCLSTNILTYLSFSSPRRNSNVVSKSSSKDLVQRLNNKCPSIAERKYQKNLTAALNDKRLKLLEALHQKKKFECMILQGRLTMKRGRGRRFLLMYLISVK